MSTRPSISRYHLRAPLRNRYEDYAGGLFRIISHFWGVHPVVIPHRYWRLFEIAGIDQSEFKEILKSINSLETWPEAWCKIGDKHHQQGELLAAFIAYYIGQRLIIVPNQIKNDLYTQAASIYMQLDHRWAVQKVEIETPAGTLRAIYQRTHLPAQGHIMLLPGVTFTKEELHYFSECFLQRGYNVLRVDHPGYGETEGSLVDHGLEYIQEFAKWQRAQDPNLELIGFGISFGGWILLQNHDVWDRWVTLCAPAKPSSYFYHLPRHSQKALLTMAGIGYDELSKEALVNLMKENTLVDSYLDKGLIIHGGRDHTIPRSDFNYLLSIFPNAQAALYPKAGHSCPDDWESIWAIALSWLRGDLSPMNTQRPWKVPPGV